MILAVIFKSGDGVTVNYPAIMQGPSTPIVPIFPIHFQGIL